MNNPSRVGRILTLLPECGMSRPTAATKSQTTRAVSQDLTVVERTVNRSASFKARVLASAEGHCGGTPRTTFRAFTLMELLAVLALLALCAATLLPALARTKAPAQRIYCANRLKGIAEAFQIWGQDHGDSFPMRVAVRNGGYSDLVGVRTVTASQTTSRGVFGMFACLSKELNTPKVLICPAENEPRLPATTFDSLIPQNTSGVVPLTNDLNVSYFVGVDAAATNPRGFLAGDHNLGSDGNVPPLSGFVTFPSTYRTSFAMSLGTNFVTNGGVGWVNTMHSAQGNVALADGSVGMYNRAQLQNALRNSGDTGHGGGQTFFNAPGSFGAEINRIQFP